jgi:hypothetical protein
MLIEVVEQRSLHYWLEPDDKKEKYKYYEAIFRKNNEVNITCTEYLRTSRNNDDKDVVQSLKNACKIKNLSGYTSLFSLTKLKFVNKILVHEPLYLS